MVSGAFALALNACRERPEESPAGASVGEPPPMVVPNDNRTPAGTLRDGALELDLVARSARWRGEPSELTEGAADPTTIAVLAFAEEGGPVTVPGPMIRVPEGTEVRVRVRNDLPERVGIGLPGPMHRVEGMSSVAADVLVVRGLRAGTVEDDVLRVRRGEIGEVRYVADRPGTYFYWAAASSRDIGAWTGIDAPLAGAIVVDPRGVEPDPAERVFVITMIDQFADPESPVPSIDLFRRAINGRSWPDTERFEYAVGETVRWRWINASAEFHPMHLHGFHYRLLARGDWRSEEVLLREERPLVVTEHMEPGTTFRMEWTPTRAGNWIFHCHTLDHITPAIERDEAARAHHPHDAARHALEAMAGLVLGLTVTDDGLEPEAEPARTLHLVAMEKPLDEERSLRGFALGVGREPDPELWTSPGPPLVLTRDELTEIVVSNRTSEATTIHWHGLELESVYDGVAGWSRTGPRIAPLVAPGESFAVRIRPPRAGTFIYHTHMDESDQLVQGMLGPLLVLEPGEAYDPRTDRVFVIGGQTDGDPPILVNGHREPSPEAFEAGTEYKLRLVHMTRGAPIDIALSRDGEPVRWRPVAKDGADLPPALARETRALLRSNTGETFDFAWTPREPGEYELSIRYEPFFEQDVEIVLAQPLRVR
jgi:FtsP/CotA-like multicopper oxidase with cupredoxin domain